ncbi:MAG: ATP-dependent DNA helicase [Actinomycetota bacterium]|nr:ATP-dependent DNA helicase [Actinomycetota bacterium]
MENRFNPSPEQEKVIFGEEKIKKIIACAGSGKTTVLTASIINILKEKKCLPSEILALTFTKNAALNMKVRISKDLSFLIDSDTIDIYTFNSFGNQIIKENSYLFGLSKNFSLLNEAKSWQIVFEIFKNSDFEYLKAKKDIAQLTRRILGYIWDIKNNLIDSVKLKKYLLEHESILSEYKSSRLQNDELKKINYLKEIYRVYVEYEKIKSLNNCIDYADQIFMPYKLFNDFISIREKYIQKYKYIFVDEFQDTNNSQAYFLSKIFDEKRNSIMIVGDDDQGIYGFRGASVENIIDTRYFESGLGVKTKPYFLTTNFRSGEKIINFVNNVISNNVDRNAKTIKSEFTGKESEIFFFKSKDTKEEALIICGMIKELREKGIMLKDMAILCRKKKFNEIIQALNKENIRFEFIGNKNLFYENEILFLVCWLKLIYNIYDEESLVYLLKSSRYKISDRDIYFLKNHIRYKENSSDDYKKNAFIPVKYLIDSLKTASENELITNDAINKINSFVEELEYFIKKSEQYDLSGIINLIFHFSGLYDEIKSGFGQNLRKKIKNVESLIRIASDFEQDNSEKNFESFIIYLQQLAKTELENPDDIEISKNNAIKIMSIHAAKGLEFKVIFLPMLWDKEYKGTINSKIEFELPAYLRTDSKIWSEKALYSNAEKFKNRLKDRAREEERRIFYVAASRAEKILIMSHPLFEDYQEKENEKPKELLEFVKEGIICGKNHHNISTNAVNLCAENDLEIINKETVFIRNKIIDRFLKLINNIKLEKKQYKKKQILNSDIKKNRAPINDFANKANIIKLEKQLSKDIYGLRKKNIERLAENYISDSNKKESKTKFFTMTEILSYIDCPKKFELKYLINIPDSTNKENADFGTKIHEIISVISKYLFSAYYWDDKGGKINEEYSMLFKKYNEDIRLIKNEKLKRSLINFFESNILDFRQTKELFIEELFYWKIGDFFIRCQTDRADILKNDFLSIYDYKSSSKKKDSDDSYYKNQIRFYLLAASEYFKIPIEKAKGYIFYLGNGHMDKNILDPALKNELESKIMLAISGIVMKDFKNKSKDKCSNCSYYSICQ